MSVCDDEYIPMALILARSCVWSAMPYYLAGTNPSEADIKKAKDDMEACIQKLLGADKELTYGIITAPLANGGLGFQPLETQFRVGQTLRLIAAVE